ncbi:MAG TPA: YlqD family protein [Bacillota bacterium]|nr:YlqD family protein [Bacillota bacterium]
MQIIKKVPIKQVVTEKSKAKMHDNFNRHKRQLEQECQQLRFEQRKLQNKPGVAKQDVARRFQQEINQRKEKIELIDFKIEQLELLENGSEIVEREVDALVEVRVGQQWDELIKETAIVVKDGVVIRIDEQ